MPRKPSFDQVYADLLSRYGQEVADAFLEGVNDLTSRAQVERVVVALAANDIEGAITALNLDPVAFNRLIDAIEASYAAGGEATGEALPKRDPEGLALLFRFDDRNPRAEAWLRDRSAALVMGIMDGARQSIRQALTDGMVRGDNPRRMALEIVGRVDRATGRRVGGVIGLTPQQERFASSAASELASGDPAQLRHYLTRELRDRRFDRTVTKAIRDGSAVPAETVQKAGLQYRARLLRYRGEVIGRTEALASLNAAQDEAVQQLVASGKVAASQVRRVWRATLDRRTRDTHAILHGESVGLNDPFRSPSGALLRFPGDPQAPVSEIAQCRCHLNIRIDWGANVR